MTRVPRFPLRRVPLTRPARVVLTVVVVLDLLVLLAFSVRRETVTRSTSQPLSTATVPQPSTARASSAPAPVTGGGALTPGGPVVVAAGGNGPAPTPTPAPSSSVPTSTPTPPPTSAAPTSPAPSGGGATLTTARCPITITKQTPPQGGLQSLITLAPAFGSFSSEAFAAASAYQPMLQLLGPVLAQYPKLAPKLAPFVTPFVSTFQLVTDTVYQLVGPLYSPYRDQVLDTETKLAAALSPYARSLAESPLGGCVVQLETALVSDTAKAAPAGS